jgi:hypothetical protein
MKQNSVPAMMRSPEISYYCPAAGKARKHLALLFGCHFEGRPELNGHSPELDIR